MNEINNTENIIRLLEFTSAYDFYILQIIQRRKDGNKKSASILKEKYISSRQYLLDNIERWIAYASDHNARIYINLNKRRMDKMGLRCMKKLTELLINNQYNSLPVLFQKTVGSYNDQEVKRWVVDIDFDENSYGTEEELIAEHIDCINYEHKSMSNNYSILGHYYTKNGYHIISEPFNLQNFRLQFSTTVHKNSPTLLFAK